MSNKKNFDSVNKAENQNWTIFLNPGCWRREEKTPARPSGKKTCVRLNGSIKILKCITGPRNHLLLITPVSSRRQFFWPVTWWWLNHRRMSPLLLLLPLLLLPLRSRPVNWWTTLDIYYICFFHLYVHSHRMAHTRTISCIQANSNTHVHKRTHSNTHNLIKILPFHVNPILNTAFKWFFFFQLFCILWLQLSAVISFSFSHNFCYQR